jgi:hypothetical protein
MQWALPWQIHSQCTPEALQRQRLQPVRHPAVAPPTFVQVYGKILVETAHFKAAPELHSFTSSHLRCRSRRDHPPLELLGDAPSACAAHVSVRMVKQLHRCRRCCCPSSRGECDASSAVLCQKGHRTNSSPLLAACSAIRSRNGAAVVTGVRSPTSDCDAVKPSTDGQKSCSQMACAHTAATSCAVASGH